MDSNDTKLVKKVDRKIETINKKIRKVATKIKSVELPVGKVPKIDSPSAEKTQAALEFGEQRENEEVNVIESQNNLEGNFTKVKVDNDNMK